MPAMLATVIVRTMGRPSLAAAMASVAVQGRQDLRLVLVDARGDLTPPATGTLPVTWVSRGKALPRPVAAQAGLDAVSTRWALFLDDDDVLLPGHLDKLLHALEQHPEAVLAHTGVELVGSGIHAQRRGEFDHAFEPWELLLGNRMPIHAALFDAARAQREGLRFDATLEVYEDWDFWLQVRQLGGFVHVPGVSARYLVGDDSSDAHRTTHGDEAYWRVWRKWWGRAPASWWSQAFQAATLTAATSQQLHATQAQVQQRLTEINALHQQLQRAGAEEAHLHTVLHERMQIVEALRAALDGMRAHWLAEQQARAEVQQRLADTQATLHATEEKLLTTEHHMAQTAQTLAASQIAQQRTADEVQAMRHSSSWRMTQPLRALATQLRQARGRLGRFKRETLSRQALLRGEQFNAHQQWISVVEAPQRQARASARAERERSGEALPTTRFSVVMPVFNAGLTELDEAIASVLAQSHAHWQLCMADDASTAIGVRERLAQWATRDARIRVVQRELNGHIAACTNTALAVADGDWVVFLDQDDLLASHALAEIADAIAAHPDAALIYSDEDKLDASGHRFEPHFKPRFSLELLRGQNFINHLMALRRSTLEAVGGLRSGFDGAQDHDLLLRVAEHLQADQVLHLPQVLYHWRAGLGSTAADASHKDYALDAALRAVGEHLQRCEPGAQVEALPGLPWMRVRYPVPATQAAVAWADPGHPAPAAAMASAGLCTLMPVDDGTVAWLLMLKPGALPISPNWLEEMLALLARPGVGVVSGALFRHSALAQGALSTELNGQVSVLAAGNAWGNPGPFGAATLVRACDAATADVMLMRRELWPLWQQSLGTDQARALAFGQAAHAAGWRVVWTPFAAFDDAAAS